MNEIHQQILELFPKSTGNIYDDYEYYANIVEVLSELVSICETNADDLLSSIIEDDLKDDRREVIFKADTKRSVDIAKLRENTELFNRFAFVKDTDAAQILGRAKLRELIQEKLQGLSDGFITANITDLEKTLGKKEASQYIVSTTTRHGTPIVVTKNSYPKDYYRLGSDEPVKVFTENVGEKPPKGISTLKY